MRRWIAVLWHASFFVLGGILYFFFVLPRWFELTGAWPVGLGMAMRIVCGALIALAALPVVFTLLRTRKSEFGTPQLALALRFWSIVLHVLAGVLISGAAISEIWVSLDAAGQILFGIYGAAAAVAVLGALAFYLAFAAEFPPPPPKPLKLERRTRGWRRDAAASGDAAPASGDAAEATNADGPETPDAVDDVEVDTPAPVSLVKTDVAKAAETTATPTTSSTEEPVGKGTGNAKNPDDDESGGTLRNRRPTGKSTSRLLGRSRRGVTLDD